MTDREPMVYVDFPMFYVAAEPLRRHDMLRCTGMPWMIGTRLASYVCRATGPGMIPIGAAADDYPKGAEVAVVTRFEGAANVDGATGESAGDEPGRAGGTWHDRAPLL